MIDADNRLNWVTMSGLGLVMEFMLEVLGLPFFPFFLLFWYVPVESRPFQVTLLICDDIQGDYQCLCGFPRPGSNRPMVFIRVRATCPQCKSVADGSTPQIHHASME